MNWVKEQLMKLFAPKYVGSVVRTALGVLSGWLLAHGADPEQTRMFVEAGTAVGSAAILYVLTQVWSLAEKAKK